MKTLLVSSMFAVALTFSFAAQAADDDKVFEGTATCAKCDLGVEKTCTDVLQVKEGDETVTYYLEGDGTKDFHTKICKKTMDVKVTGTVAEKDGKKVITTTKIVES